MRKIINLLPVKLNFFKIVLNERNIFFWLKIKFLSYCFRMELTPLPLKVGQTAKCIATQVSKDADLFFHLIYYK